MRQFFCEDNDRLSLNRLQSLILVISGIIYAFIHQDIVVSAMLIGFGVTGKIVQKGMEKGK